MPLPGPGTILSREVRFSQEMVRSSPRVPARFRPRRNRSSGRSEYFPTFYQRQGSGCRPFRFGVAEQHLRAHPAFAAVGGKLRDDIDVACVMIELRLAPPTSRTSCVKLPPCSLRTSLFKTSAREYGTCGIRRRLKQHQRFAFYVFKRSDALRLPPDEPDENRQHDGRLKQHREQAALAENDGQRAAYISGTSAMISPLDSLVRDSG